MDNVISRFRNTANLIVLVAVLALQVIGLAVQVQRPTDAGPTRLIRIWAISIVTPITRSVVHTQDWFSDTWHNYIWLRDVRKQNEALKDQIVQMKMQEVRLIEDANQARRLQLLLGFKEKYIAKTVPAQVISTTGSEFSSAIFIDKGENDGIKHDMPVITPQGIVGKILRVFPTTSLVLLINDPGSGAGVILEKSRLRAILKGSTSGNGSLVLDNVMSDEKVAVGENIVTSGGDGVYPKGLPVGTVASVGPGQDLFLKIRVRPAAEIGRLEEVLVVTQVDSRTPQASPEENPMRAIDILAERLPTVAPPKQDEAAVEGAKPGATATPEEKKAAPKPPATGTTAEKKTASPELVSGAVKQHEQPAANAGNGPTKAAHNGTVNLKQKLAPLGLEPSALKPTVQTKPAAAVATRTTQKQAATTPAAKTPDASKEAQRP